ncbi:MAG: type II toxin-antitoxin system VapC family toxin [Trueperaceae bacterium]
MKILFDTSVLVAALSVRHPLHSKALGPFQKVMVGRIEGCFSTHTLAELYSVMTGHPSWRISPLELQQVLEEMLHSFEVIHLTSQDYQQCIQRIASLSFSGGAIFDALHAQTALKANVDTLLTFNKKHFVRLGNDIANLVKEP